MFQRLSKYLMNEADAGSGNGAQAAPAAPAQPQASSAATPAPAVVPVDQLAGVLAEQMASLRNGIFADLRKAGVFKDKPQEPQAPTPQSAPSSAPTPAPAAASVDPASLLDLRDAFDDATSELKLNKDQRRLLRDHVMSKRPDSSAVEKIVGDFVRMAGWAAPVSVPSASTTTPPATQATQQPATPAPAKPNISDRGTAAPTDLRDFEGVLNSRPLEMTRHDVDDLILKHGQDKGMQMFQERVLAALGRVRIKPPRG